jgi:hypothetical protein
MATYEDPRFKTIGKLHKHKEVTTFADIFAFIPKSLIANELKISHHRFNALMANPGNFTFNEVAVMAGLFGMKYRDLAKMVEETIK